MEKKQLRYLVLSMSSIIILTFWATDRNDIPVGESSKYFGGIEFTSNADETTQVKVTFDILIEGESITELNQVVNTSEGTSLMDVMRESYDIEDEGGFISEIEGHEQDEKSGYSWTYYVNNQIASVEASEYELQNEDIIEWRLESSPSK